MLFRSVSNGDGDGGGVDGDGSGGNSPSRQGAGTETSLPPKLVSAMAAATELFVELCSGVQGFPVTENKYAEGRGRWMPGGPTPPLGAGPGLAAPRHGVATLGPPFDSPSDFVFVS